MNKSLPLIAISLAILPTVLLPDFTPAAKALGCVNVDVGNQISVSGSPNPGTQTNQVKQSIDPNCLGNVNVTKTTQLDVGAGSANQQRTSEQHSGGLGKHPVIPAGVMEAGNVNIQVGTGTQVYSPALNPNFLPKK
jgi:hypothetical protein